MPLKKLKKLKKSYFCKIIIACVPYSYGCGYPGIGLSAGMRSCHIKSRQR